MNNSHGRHTNDDDDDGGESERGNRDQQRVSIDKMFLVDVGTLPSTGHGSRASMTSTGLDVCRICHCNETESQSELMSPCACAGSLKYVHQTCLQQWVKSANTKSCELCKYEFEMSTKVKPFRKVSAIRL